MRLSETKTAALATAVMLAARAALAQEEETPAEPERRIVISLADRKLALIENGRVVKVWSTAVGKPSTPTPAGVYKIANRIPNPTWWGPKKEVVGPGKGNPLGTRWMGLSLKGYGIHGTNDPRSIGRRASHGCIRMRNADVEELFAKIRVGDMVELVAEPGEELAWIFGATEPVAAE